MAKPPQIKMKRPLEALFGDIAEKAILKAERIPCQLEQFKRGLETMQNAIKNRIGQVISEIDNDD